MIAKKFFKRFMPNPKKIQHNKFLKIFGNLLDRPYLWYLNRNNLATAFSIGLFITYMPFPGHMVVATLLAILLRANLPITLAMVWVVNPLTMIPMFGFAYLVGAHILHFPLHVHFESVSIMLHELWQPFVLGCVVCGGFLAISSNIAVRWLWRYLVIKQWQQRQLRRALVHAESSRQA